MRVLSLAAIVAASLLFSQKTDFPGSAAALPTLATVIMLVVGQANASGVTYRLLSLPPIQYVGDTSYSIYLWHWPIIIFAGALMAGGAMSPGQQLILIGAILVSSHFSKTLIEDRFRKAPRATANLTRTVALGAPSALACSSLAALALMLVAYEPGLRNSVLALTSATRVEFNPPLSEVKGDLPEIYRDGCFATAEDVAPRPCQYGDRDGAVHVMLLGDSHAAQWLPALSILAHQQHWRLSVHAKGACPFVTQMVEKNQKPYEACLEWDKRVLAELQAGPPDVVIISQVSDKRLFGQKPRPELMAAALAATWRELRALGATVIVLRDTPVFNLDPTDCLSQNVNCAGRLRDVSRPSPIPIALALQPEVQSIDMTDQLCPDGRCSAAIGNLVVWRDKHHLTATFAKTLAPVLGQRIATILHSLTVATRIVAP
jgi:hypothetical protein